MKRIVFILLINILAFSINSSAQNVRAYLNYNEFYSPKDGPFLETYISIEGSSLQWVKEGKYLKAEAEATIIFRKDSQIVQYSKSIISSPKVYDSTGINNNFMHIDRFTLDTGNYSVSIKLDDLNDTLDAFFTTTQINISSPIDSIFISSIEVFRSKTKDNIGIDPFSKSGYSLIPNIYNFLSVSDSVLNFYAEIYNTEKLLGKSTPYLFTYSILNDASKSPIKKFSKFKRLTSKPVQSIIGNFDISTLPSNNFILRLEVRDKKNNLKASKDYIFQRQNTVRPIDLKDISSINIASTFVELITGVDTLKDIIESFYPISTPQEQAFAKTITRDKDEFVMQQYIYSFWEKRNINDPFKAFRNYMAEVRLVEDIYGGRIHKGYETDRGYIYLKYGKPNSVAKDYSDPAAYPYEIWHYYKTRSQSNVKFVFYNTDLASKDFRLLHSTAIGEVSDYQWRLRLRKRDSGYKSIDDNGNATDDWGSNVNRYYENPR